MARCQSSACVSGNILTPCLKYDLAPVTHAETRSSEKTIQQLFPRATAILPRCCSRRHTSRCISPIRFGTRRYVTRACSYAQWRRFCLILFRWKNLECRQKRHENQHPIVKTCPTKRSVPLRRASPDHRRSGRARPSEASRYVGQPSSINPCQS